MRALQLLSTGESILKGRLVMQEHWFERVDKLLSYLIAAAFVVFPLLSYRYLKAGGPNDRIFAYFVFPLSILTGCYFSFRLATEKRLIRLKTAYTKEQMYERLLEYASKHAFTVSRSSQACLIFTESTSDLNPSQQVIRIFLLKDGMVMFTVLRHGYRIYTPVMFRHLFLRYDMQRLFDQTPQTGT